VKNKDSLNRLSLFLQMPVLQYFAKCAVRYIADIQHIEYNLKKYKKNENKFGGINFYDLLCSHLNRLFY